MQNNLPTYPHYKPSGIQWLGDIPEHWEVKKLKFIADVILGKMLCNEDKGNYQLKPYLKSKNIQWLNVDIASVDQMWFSPKEMIEYRLKEGDLVLSEGGEVGKTCIWNNELKECYIQNSAHKVTFQNDYSKYYLYHFFSAGQFGIFDSIVNKGNCLGSPLEVSDKNILNIADDVAVHFANCRNKTGNTGIGIGSAHSTKAIADLLFDFGNS